MSSFDLLFISLLLALGIGIRVTKNNCKTRFVLLLGCIGESITKSNCLWYIPGRKRINLHNKYPHFQYKQKKGKKSRSSLCQRVISSSIHWTISRSNILSKQSDPEWLRKRCLGQEPPPFQAWCTCSGTFPSSTGNKKNNASVHSCYSEKLIGRLLLRGILGERWRRWWGCSSKMSWQ